MYPHFLFLGHTFLFTFDKKRAERTPKHKERGSDEVRLCLLLCMCMVNHWNDKFRVKFIELPKLDHQVEVESLVFSFYSSSIECNVYVKTKERGHVGASYMEGLNDRPLVPTSNEDFKNLELNLHCCLKLCTQIEK